ncbi:MAG: hypothetical protein V7607_611 [Solirubrobacteraceae bacterium]
MRHALAQIGFRVPDVDASAEHLSATLGLEVVEPDGDVVRLAFPDHSPCVNLKPDAEAALDYVGFVTSGPDLDVVVRRARGASLTVDDGRQFGDVRLYAPNRLAIEVRSGEPEPRNTRRRDAGPCVGSLDHVSLTAAELDATVAFFVEILGFVVSDSVGEVRHWLRCGPNHHTVAVFAGGDRLQHYAFEADDVRELASLGDVLALRGQNFLWGPGRHALGANTFTYHLDPAGAVLELTCDMAQVPEEEEWVAQVWSPDTPASAVMWGPMPPPGFREAGIPIFDHLATGEADRARATT